MWYSWCVNVDSYVLCAVITIPLFLSIVKLQKSKRYHQLNCTFPFVELWRNMKIIIWCNNYMNAQSFYTESLDLFVPFSIWSLYFLFFLELPLLVTPLVSSNFSSILTSMTHCRIILFPHISDIRGTQDSWFPYNTSWLIQCHNYDSNRKWPSSVIHSFDYTPLITLRNTRSYVTFSKYFDKYQQRSWYSPNHSF